MTSSVGSGSRSSRRRIYTETRNVSSAAWMEVALLGDAAFDLEDGG
jgi:hypothetical protein